MNSLAVRFGAAAFAMIATIMASAAEVHESWTVLKNGPTNHADMGNLIAVGPSGDVYVAATSYNATTFRYDLTLLRYDSAGAEVWSETLPYRLLPTGPTGLAVDSAGNPIVTSSSYDEPGVRRLSIWKFDGATGTLAWERLHPEAGDCLVGDVATAAVALDAADNVVAAGCGMNLYKYAADGTLLWQRGGVPAKLDYATDIAVDPAGGVHLAGNDTDFSTVGVVVYDAAGTLVWDHVTHGPIFNTFGRTRVALGPAGETVIAADVESMCGVGALRLVRYDASGAELWHRDFQDTPCTNFQPAGVAVASTGDIYVAGSLGSGADIAALKYLPDGTRDWVRTYDGPAHSTDVAFDMAMDAHDNFYIVGEELFQAPQNRDIVTLKYDLAGNLDWSISYAGPAGGNDRPQSIAIGACGQAYVTGYGWNPPFNSDIYVLAYTQDFPGDLDGDGDVDLRGFALFQQDITQSTTPPVPGDLDGDDDVDLDDFILLLHDQSPPCN